ncbi:MAG: hypothetical protein F9K49_04185, partial [Caedimonadaceae bacterium]
MEIAKSILYSIGAFVFLLQSVVAEATLVNTLEKIQKKGYLEVSMTSKDQPPFFMTNEKGELIGIDVEIAFHGDGQPIDAGIVFTAAEEERVFTHGQIEGAFGRDRTILVPAGDPHHHIAFVAGEIPNGGIVARGQVIDFKIERVA